MGLPHGGPRVKGFGTGMDALERIGRIVAPTIEGMGYDLVRVHLTGGQRPTLQIMADRLDEAPMTVEDCAEISRAVSAVLDVEDPLPGAYTLEVSSPGIDRPLTRLRDFERFAGLEAKLETIHPLAIHPAAEGRKRFQGRLAGLRGEDVLLTLELKPARQTRAKPGQKPKTAAPAETETIAIPFADIQKAKLVLNDELLAMAAAAQAGAAPGTEGGEMEVEDRPRRPRKGAGKHATDGQDGADGTGPAGSTDD